MNKNNLLILTIILLSSIILFSACSSSSGNNISVQNFSPSDGTVIYIGDPIAISAQINVENNLTSYEIQIYKNNKNSNSRTTEGEITEKVPFQINKTGSLLGKNVTFSQVIDVSLFVGEKYNLVEEGNYNLVVTIKDNFNNQFIITRNLVFKNK